MLEIAVPGMVNVNERKVKILRFIQFSFEKFLPPSFL